MAPQPFQLVMRTGPNPGKVFELTKNELFIGRDISNDIVISDAEVSRKHARLALQTGGYMLEDLGSTNGTFAGGQRLMGPHLLQPGETIMLGENISLSFEAGYDENATLISSSAAPTVYSPQPKQPAPPISRPVPRPSKSYREQIPQAPVEPYYAEPQPVTKKSNRTLLWAGCGVLLVLLCIVISGAFLFDYLNLYCTPPFNILFACP
jgi:pSer/pThr/pTyr-binding forkhead associated (FHA) protein